MKREVNWKTPKFSNIAEPEPTHTHKRNDKKIDFLRENKQLFEDALNGNRNAEYAFSEKARKEIPYSSKTAGCDIFRSFRKLYDEFFKAK